MKKQFTNTELLCFALGWQGGTIWQVCDETGLDADQILSLDPSLLGTRGGEDSDQGWMALRTCSVEFNRENNFPKHRGSLSFWTGVVRAMKFSIDNGEERAGYRLEKSI